MVNLSRRHLLGGTASLAILSAVPPEVFAAAASARPNIVFIMADDLGYADLGCYGARDIRTPNLDFMAAGGLRLTDGYANSPVCSATRTALITGRYQYRLRCGLEEPIGIEDIGLPPEEPTLPKYLRDLGYRTALVGKWHLGRLPNYSPLLSGYDRFFGIEDGGADYFTHRLVSPEFTTKGLIEGDTPVESFGYLTDQLGDRAVREIELAVEDSKPLFLSLHFTAPHWPWEGPEDEAVSKLVHNPMHPDGGNLETYGRMVESMDTNVGKVLAALDRLGIADNTILVFTSDNGGERFSDVWPFTGAKTELLEGGIRVPIILRWPDRIPAGVTSAQVMASMDFAPTFIRAVGGEVTDAMGFDGSDLLPVLTGEAAPFERQLFWRYKYADQRAVRRGQWKYLQLGGREYLFDLAADQHERADRKAHEPELFAQLKADYESWNSGMLEYPEDMPSHSISEFLPDRYAPPTKPSLSD